MSFYRRARVRSGLAPGGRRLFRSGTQQSSSRVRREGRRAHVALVAAVLAAAAAPMGVAAQTPSIPSPGFSERFGLDMLGGEFSQVGPASSWAIIGTAYSLSSVDPLSGAIVPSDVSRVVSPDRAVTHDLMRDGLLAFDTQQAADQARMLAEERRRSIAVDRLEDLPEDFDTAKLTDCGAKGNENFLARVDAVVAFDRLCRAAEADGVSLQVVSALRTPSEQHSLWRRAVATYGSEEAARRWVAPSDGVSCSSNHCVGVALDVSVSGNDAARRWLHAPVGCHVGGAAVFGDSDCDGGRVVKRAQLYGFIFPLPHEPWHMELGVRLG